MNEQLQLDLGVINENDECIDLDNEEEEEENECDIVYKSRLKKLVKEIAKVEEFNGVQLSKEAVEKFEGVSKLLISTLIFDILNQLRITGRKKITPKDVDTALDGILNKASSIDIALELLNDNINKLTELNKKVSISKATKFVNQ
ncbi:hypothetical protein [Clostridium butyricum]|uniref:hypothetical protein n=1 Tax=Clostridium butyricum TaxID=1492 RepID=UPI00071B7222|nr:hypothetical protein [Clostridium butyricum]ALP90821.1 hypothetical protein ATN24_11955 [Clostridium butyricum]ALS17349.1 hypothetical protein ATD26_10860 [Clostridium butyricum]ANF14444.1 hypothetical protein AZ909_10405 [Clostridium butyricum]AOR94509.1 hypothetical protein BBB49_10585 [Clostridium butyricum]MCI3008649.1 hypothetical protein [Clostridium butyricum]